MVICLSQAGCLMSHLIRVYILGGRDDHELVESDLLSWGQWLEQHSNRVAFDEIDGVNVSTVFLGMCHRFPFSPGPPVVFETMIFTDAGARLWDRCSTWDEAVAMHARAVEAVKVKVHSGLP